MSYPFVPARWYTPGPANRDIRFIVMHSMEAPELPETAEGTARFFQNLPASNKASAHLCVDNNSIIECVRENDIAYAAPGANATGYQIELAGYARQTRGEWLDGYGKAMLEIAAKAAADVAKRHGIPTNKLDANGLKQPGWRGFVGHVDVSNAFHQTDHTDPGGGFPWDYFLDRVRYYLNPPKEAPKVQPQFNDPKNPARAFLANIPCKGLGKGRSGYKGKTYGVTVLQDGSIHCDPSALYPGGLNGKDFFKNQKAARLKISKNAQYEFEVQSESGSWYGLPEIVKK